MREGRWRRPYSISGVLELLKILLYLTNLITFFDINPTACACNHAIIHPCIHAPIIPFPRYPNFPDPPFNPSPILLFFGSGCRPRWVLKFPGMLVIHLK